MLDTPEEVRRHIGFKLSSHELRAPVAEHMLAALDAGAAPDYQALLRAAMFPDPPTIIYHTAPVAQREAILIHGLKVSQPGAGGSWAPNKELCRMLQGAQPPGIYACAEPDAIGVWAHWAAWDVWEVRRGDITWAHDDLNPGCWSLRADVPPEALSLQGTYGAAAS
jgi:hypothetical protein